MLVTLSKTKYINYAPQKKTSFIVYPTTREETQYVRIPTDVYEKRKKNFEDRIGAMINYVEKEDVCRSKMLLAYFNETDAKNCGICDVCLKRNKIGLSHYEFEKIGELLIESFTNTKSFRIKELIESLKFSFADIDKVNAVLQFLVNQGVFHLENDIVTLQNKS